MIYPSIKGKYYLNKYSFFYRTITYTCVFMILWFFLKIFGTVFLNIYPQLEREEMGPCLSLRYQCKAKRKRLRPGFKLKSPS